MWQNGLFQGGGGGDRRQDGLPIGGCFGFAIFVMYLEFGLKY